MDGKTMSNNKQLTEPMVISQTASTDTAQGIYVEHLKKKKTMSNNKETTALNQHLKWLKKELKRVIDDGESESWVYAYKIAIKNAESLIEKYENEQ